jgi:hypothetical protein
MISGDTKKRVYKLQALGNIFFLSFEYASDGSKAFRRICRVSRGVPDIIVGSEIIPVNLVRVMPA